MPEPLWKTLARRMGMEIPPEVEDVSPEQQELYDEIVRRQQAEDPTWKKAGRGLVNTVGGAVEGMLGYEPNPTRRDVGDFTNLATQGVTGLAGLPFAAYKALRKTPLTHGTQKAFETFDPSKYDKNDVLGWMTHAAEDPVYSGSYSMGMKGKHIPDEGSLTQKNLLNYEGEKLTPRMIPIEPEAKNVLDLVDPNPDDMSAALASLDDFTKQALIRQFKNTRRMIRENPPNDPKKFLEDVANIDSRHLKGTNISPSEIPVRVLSERIRLNPEQFKNTQFDAIRYNDMSNKSWAFPETTPLKTPYGVPLNTAPRDLKVIRDLENKSRGGMLEHTPDRWANTPLNVSDTPKSDALKYSDLDETELYNFLGWDMNSPISETTNIHEALEKAQKAKSLTPKDIKSLENILELEIKDGLNDPVAIQQAKKWINKYKDEKLGMFDMPKENQPGTADFAKFLEDDYVDFDAGIPKKPINAKNYFDEPNLNEIINDQAIPMFPGMTDDLIEEASQQIDQMMEWGQITKEQYQKLHQKLNAFVGQ